MEETGVQRSSKERLVRSRLQWAGHVEWMADDTLPMRAAVLREQGRRSSSEAKAEKGVLCYDICEEVRRGGRLAEEDNIHMRVEKTIR